MSNWPGNVDYGHSSWTGKVPRTAANLPGRWAEEKAPHWVIRTLLGAGFAAMIILACFL